MLRAISWIVVLVSLSCGCMAGEPAAVCTYELEVSVDPVRSAISGTARISIPKGSRVELDAGSLAVGSVTLDGKALPVARSIPAASQFDRPALLRIDYTGVFPEPAPLKGDPMRIPSNVAGRKGVSLTGTWYPRPDGLCVFSLRVTLPADWEAVSEADAVEKHTGSGRSRFVFHFPYPAKGITLVASDRYRTLSRKAGATEVLAYFFPEDLSLATRYLEFASRYLALYERLIGPYPYRRFAVVEHFLPTGYSMPTFTLLGQDVVRLPFIVETSLGHEVLHQWFGNLVYVDYAKGNWAEGLTTYLADHLYETEKNRGAAYRKNLLVDYESYTREGKDFPLRSFTGRTDLATRAVGYGKGAMLFHMLRRQVGDEAFFASLRDLVRTRAHKTVSWDEIGTAFSARSGQDLSWFFSQWLDRTGLPRLSLTEVRAEPEDEDWVVYVTVRQGKQAYRLALPVRVRGQHGEKETLLDLRTTEQTFQIPSRGRPLSVVVDDAYDVARHLVPQESPPVIGRLLADGHPLVVMPSSHRESYAAVIDGLGSRGAVIEQADTAGRSLEQGGTLVILSSANPLASRLFGRLPRRSGFSLTMRRHPFDETAVVAVIDSTSPTEAAAAWGKMVHYGRYSEVAFSGGSNVLKEVARTDSGIAAKLPGPTIAVEQSSFASTDEVVDRVAGKKVIYVGETHDRYAHHLAQLEIIRGLHRRGHKVAIGMEMFQRPFQKALDDYIAGRTDEKQFLRDSGYFARWGYDYALYRPILNFARSEGLPVIALNMEAEIVKRVSMGGMDSLSSEDRRRLPEEMDFSDEAYRERLQKVWQQHAEAERRPFSYFLQAQIVWDETMAESVDRFLKARPEYQMVVLAGSGHLAYGSGIPKRVARRNGQAFAIVLNDTEPEKGVTDFLLFPAAVAGGVSPKLLVMLKEEGGTVTIDGFSHGSGAEEAGLKKGDRIVAVKGQAVRSFEDVRIELALLNKGDRVSVKAVRKEALGDRELTFEVELR